MAMIKTVENTFDPEAWIMKAALLGYQVSLHGENIAITTVPVRAMGTVQVDIVREFNENQDAIGQYMKAENIQAYKMPSLSYLNRSHSQLMKMEPMICALKTWSNLLMDVWLEIEPEKMQSDKLGRLMDMVEKQATELYDFYYGEEEPHEQESKAA